MTRENNIPLLTRCGKNKNTAEHKGGAYRANDSTLKRTSNLEMRRAAPACLMWRLISRRIEPIGVSETSTSLFLSCRCLVVTVEPDKKTAGRLVCPLIVGVGRGLLCGAHVVCANNGLTV